MLAYIVAGDTAKAATQLKQSPPKAPAKKHALADAHMERQLRVVLMMLAIAKDDISEAVSILKSAKKPFTFSYVATHFGHADRLARVLKAFQTLTEESGTPLPDDFAEYLTKVESHVQELAAKAAEAEKPPAEEKTE